MTQEQSLQVNDPFLDKAKALLNEPTYNALVAYISNNKPEISVTTCQKFFELYLSGDSVEEIHRLNSAFPIEAIHWARIKYNWDELKTQYIMSLQNKVMEKVYKAQLETTGLYADILSAAQKKFGDKIRKFLQTGNEDDLGDALKIDSLHQLIKMGEALQKITGQDKNIKITKDNNFSFTTGTSQPNANAIEAEVMEDDLSSEDAAKILNILAEAKRKKDAK